VTRFQAVSPGEIRREISDEAHARKVLDADLTRTRFLEGARQFVADHGQVFADEVVAGRATYGASPTS
jgi:hypothetical protein